MEKYWPQKRGLMAKKQRSLISEDKHSFLVHDGDKHFAIAKRSISEDMHDKIRKLPKYAQGGIVEGGEIPDARMDSASKLGVTSSDLNGIDQFPIPTAQQSPARAPASFDGQNHPILKMFPDFFFDKGVNPYKDDAPQTVPSPEAPPVEAGPAPASMPAQPVAQPAQQAVPAAPEHNILGGFQGAGKQYVRGLQEEQKAQSDLGKSEADIYKNMFPPEFEQDLKTRFNDLQKERAEAKVNLDKTREAAFQGKEDPSRYWNNLSTGNKVMGSIALILGGAASGGNANNNVALNTLNQAIDRDVQAQRNDKASAQNLYRANLERYKDADTAQQMTTLQLKTVAEGKLMAAAASARDPIAKAKLDQAVGTFQRQNVIEGEQVYQQQASRKLLQSLTGPSGSQVNPATKVRVLSQTGAIPKEQVEPIYKELQEAQNMKDMHAEGMRIFDEVAQLNTVGGKFNPQTRSKIEGKMGPYIEGLTKDKTGRVTPENVALIKQAFSAMLDNPETVEEKRKDFNNYLLQKSSFPHLDAFPELKLNPLSNIIYSRPAPGVSKGK